MRIGTFALGIVVASIDDSSEELESGPIMPEPSFYRKLSYAAKRLGIHLYIFTADSYHRSSGELYAYRFVRNQWLKQLVPLPDIIYDRCFFSHPNERARCHAMLEEIKQRKRYIRLNGSLPSKLDVYDALRGDRRLAPYLPITTRYYSAQQLTEQTARSDAGIVLKPAAGMQGRGIAHITQFPLDQSFRVYGRMSNNRPFSIVLKDAAELRSWLNRFIGRTTYLIQPYLELTGTDRIPFDVRALMQKDDKGYWTLTGTAIRCGQPNSLTSNLHGGGDAELTSALLKSKFGSLKSEHLHNQIHTISGQTVERLESKFGRFAEIGLDYGIEPDGKLWILEANSKPGRSSFQRINDQEAERLSIERPLLYASLLASRLHPYLITNEAANGRLRHSRNDNSIRPFNVQEVHR